MLGVWGCLSYPTLFSAGWDWCLSRWLSFAPCSRWCPLSGCTSLRLQVLGDSWFSPLCSPDRRSASRFTYPALCPVSRLSFRLGDFSSGEASVSLLDPIALSPLLHRVFPDGFRHWCSFCFCGGASPLEFGPVGALGESRWLHLYRLTPDLVGLSHFAGCHWCSGRCFMFSCATFRPYSWRSFGQFH